MMAAIVSPAIAETLASEDVPEGITGQLDRQLASPNPSKLLAFATWLSSRGMGPACQSLRRLVCGRSGAWLARLAELRNEMFHPKQLSPQQTQHQFDDEVSCAPDLAGFGEIRITGDEAHWICGDDCVALFPCTFAEQSMLWFFSGYEESRLCLSFERPTPPGWDNRCREVLLKCRCLDRKLYNPTAEDIHRKARWSKPTCKSHPSRWASTLLRTAAPGAIVHRGFLGNLLASAANQSDRVVIDVELHNDTTPSDAIAETLGLMSPPTPAEIARWFTSDRTALIGVRTEGLTSHGFGELMYWISHLAQHGASGRLLVAIERDNDVLRLDEKVLFDRIPLPSTVLALARRNHSEDLLSFQWPSRRRWRLWPFSVWHE